jgi:hypothetical protein
VLAFLACDLQITAYQRWYSYTAMRSSSHSVGDLLPVGQCVSVRRSMKVTLARVPDLP